jgi:hypothetical protein
VKTERKFRPGEKVVNIQNGEAGEITAFDDDPEVYGIKTNKGCRMWGELDIAPAVNPGEKAETKILKGHTYKMHNGEPGTVFKLPGEPYTPGDDKPGRPDYTKSYGIVDWGTFCGYVGEKAFAHPIEEIT